VAEVLRYARRKLDLARRAPRESRLFAGEVLRGAPHLRAVLAGPLAALVADKARVLEAWMDEGRLARHPPEHLIFSVWALTQHYADFDAQVRAVLGPARDPFAEAAPFLDALFARLVAP
jgi:TetR/AcrR family transcriptional regulator